MKLSSEPFTNQRGFFLPVLGFEKKGLQDVQLQEQTLLINTYFVYLSQIEKSLTPNGKKN